MLFDPPPVTNCHTFSDPSPSSVTYFMDGPLPCYSTHTLLASCLNSTGFLSSHTWGRVPLVPSGCMRAPLKSRPVCVSWWDARIGHYYCTHNRVLVSFLTPINSAHQDSVGLVKAQQTTTSDMIGRHPAIIIVY